MERLKLIRSGEVAGEVTLTPEGLYLSCSAVCKMAEGLWELWLIGEQGELRLGIPEPEDGVLTLRRHLPLYRIEAVGTLLRAELRPRDADLWQRPAKLENCPAWLGRLVPAQQEARVRQSDTGIDLALPMEPQNRFPLPAYFCFARLFVMEERAWWAFSFDQQGRPQLLEENHTKNFQK